MFKKPVTIIGINPGAKYLGISVFSGSELRDWRIRSIKGKWSKGKTEKVKIIISNLIERYKPDALAIKKLNPSRSSSDLNNLVTKIKILSERKGARVYQYSIKDLENFFSPEERINKNKLAKIMVSEYPFLFHELNKENNNKNNYHIRMFEAVALGSVCFHQLDKKYVK